MFSNAKVGQRVWSYTYGWGEIINITNEDFEHEYPIEFLSDKGYVEYYNGSGKFEKDAINQDLFYDEIKVEIQESAKKPKVEWPEFPNYGIENNRKTIVYFKSYSKGAVIWSEVHEVGCEPFGWNMEEFTPCTLEAKTEQ